MCAVYVVIKTVNNTMMQPEHLSSVLNTWLGPDFFYFRIELTANSFLVEPVLSRSSCSRPSLWVAAQRKALMGRWEPEAALCLTGNSGSPVFCCPPPTTTSCSPARLLLALPLLSQHQWQVDISWLWKPSIYGHQRCAGVYTRKTGALYKRATERF